MQDGSKIAVLSIGTTGNPAAKAVKMAKEQGIDILHYNMRFLKPLDYNALEEVCKKCTSIITIEDGSIIGGLYSSVCEYIASNNFNIYVKGLGIPDRFIEQGTVAELHAECGIDTNSIYRTIADVSQRT
ncbi:1-deoxy-D-xylulose-5-phosphate synthase [bioreactor metagenome]|uniref:1-deoxy-D-xylulose-5-phosphate synthase n=1 Tax=bioreactor metagenome TaxID=1076179 RepID=A0A645BV98_9ZZZZ